MDDARSQTAEEAARNYYASDGVDTFYSEVWGGEDIHIGVYDEPGNDVASASRRTVDLIADGLGDALHRDARVIDFGSGYGGSARRIAQRFGCTVRCLNLSEIQNARNTQMTAEQGLADRVSVVTGSYQAVPEANESFDIVWSQDALLHAPDANGVVREAFRVLRPGGCFTFTDPMQNGDGPKPELRAVYQRCDLDEMFSPDAYRRTAAAAGFEEMGFEDWTPHMAAHYAKIDEELRARRDALLAKDVPADFMDRMSEGLGHWVAGAKAGALAWGVFRFRKPLAA